MLIGQTRTFLDPRFVVNSLCLRSLLSDYKCVNRNYEFIHKVVLSGSWLVSSICCIFLDGAHVSLAIASSIWLYNGI